MKSGAELLLKRCPQKSHAKAAVFPLKTREENFAQEGVRRDTVAKNTFPSGLEVKQADLLNMEDLGHRFADFFSQNVISHASGKDAALTRGTHFQDFRLFKLIM